MVRIREECSQKDSLNRLLWRDEAGGVMACLSLLLLLNLFLVLGCVLDAAGNEVQIPLSVGGDCAALGGGAGGHNIDVPKLRQHAHVDQSRCISIPCASCSY
jgi:hypothetical protein